MSLCDLWLLFCQWVPPERAWIPFLPTFLSGIWTHCWVPYLHKPSFLCAEQSPLFIWETLQSPNHPSSILWHYLYQLYIFHCTGKPRTGQLSRCGLISAEQRIISPDLLVTVFLQCVPRYHHLDFFLSQEHLGCVQLCILQDSLVLLCPAAFQLINTKICFMSDIFPLLVQDSTFSLVEIYKAVVRPFISPACPGPLVANTSIHQADMCNWHFVMYQLLPALCHEQAC